MNEQSLLKMSFGNLYSLYLNKVQRKGRTQEELDELLVSFSGYSTEALYHCMNQTLKSFLIGAPDVQRYSNQVKGVICKVRVETMEEGYMKQLRAMDKVVDDLAKGQALTKIKSKYLF